MRRFIEVMILIGIFVGIPSALVVAVIVMAKEDQRPQTWHQFETPSGVTFECWGTGTELSHYDIARCVTAKR